MAEEVFAVPIDLGEVGTGVVLLKKSVTDYFNIAVTATTNQTSVTRSRKSYSREIYDGLTATVKKTVGVRASTWEATPSAPKKGSGQKIIVPTELKTSKGIIRMVTMRFPQRAVTGAISKFLFTKCTAHKPTYFLTEAGEKHLVLAVTRNVNPEPTSTPTPTPTP